MSCPDKHARDDYRLGEPLARTATTTPARLLNACAPELWRRFTITLRRAPCSPGRAHQQGVRRPGRLSYAKVAEYQRRGVVHFHAIIRLDGPTGPPPPHPPGPPSAYSPKRSPGRPHRPHRHPGHPGLRARTLAWGRQIDTRPVTTTGDLTDSKVAAYVAKYATKAAEATGTLDRRITPADRLAELPIRDHARRHIAECLRLAKLPAPRSPAPGRLGAHARLLRPLRHQEPRLLHHPRRTAGRPGRPPARNRHRRRAVPDLLSDTTVTVADWHFAGRAYLPSISELAAIESRAASPLTGGAA